MTRVTKFVVCAALIVAARYAAAAPATEAAQSARNNIVVAMPDIYWSADAGTNLEGRVTDGTFYSSVVIRSETTVPVWICWRNGTRRINYKQRCAKICVGCNNGSSYRASVVTAQTDLFAIYVAPSDAGPVQLQSTDAGVVLAVEYAR